MTDLENTDLVEDEARENYGGHEECGVTPERLPDEDCQSDERRRQTDRSDVHAGKISQRPSVVNCQTRRALAEEIGIRCQAHKRAKDAPLRVRPEHRPKTVVSYSP